MRCQRALCARGAGGGSNYVHIYYIDDGGIHVHILYRCIWIYNIYIHICTHSSIYIHIHIYIYIYVYVHIHMHMHLYTHIYICIYLYIYTYIYIYICICIYTYKSIFIHIYTYVCSYTNVYIYIYVYVYIYVNTYIYIYICIYWFYCRCILHATAHLPRKSQRSDISQMNASCITHECVMSPYECVMSHDTFMCDTLSVMSPYECVMSHIQMSHVTQVPCESVLIINESCLTYECIECVMPTFRWVTSRRCRARASWS